jgi:hypothetical protein
VLVLVALEGRLLWVALLKVREVFIVDRSEGGVVNETVACEVVILVSVVNLMIGII